MRNVPIPSIWPIVALCVPIVAAVGAALVALVLFISTLV
jgi:hypothetical protein